MRKEAAFKIQRFLKITPNLEEELDLKVDQLYYLSSIRKIQMFVRGRHKLKKSRRSKVNPAVEQVLRDPERVQNSKMI